MKKLSVVIVNYNVKHYLEQCLLSLRRALQGIDAEIIVVDNHSQDGSVDFLRSRFPEIEIVSCLHNAGFARANNIAIRQAKGEYVLLLNPDTIVGESTLWKTLAFMDAHPKGGALGVRMLHTTGEPAWESRRGLPSPMVAFYKMSGLCDRFPQNPSLGHYYMGGLSWDEPAEIEVVSGAFCLLRRRALDEVGMLDEDFFMYGEDIDISFRLLKARWHNYYYPANILHYKGESTEKSSFRYVHVFYEAMLIFFRKHYSGMSWLLNLPIKTAIYAKAMMALTQMMAREMHKSLGFYGRRKPKKEMFIGIGSEHALSECARIIKENGLQASFVKEAKLTQSEECLASYVQEMIEKCAVEKNSTLYIIYDVETYSYDEIFDRVMKIADVLRAKGRKKLVKLATYSSVTHKIITENEIYEGKY